MDIAQISFFVEKRYNVYGSLGVRAVCFLPNEIG